MKDFNAQHWNKVYNTRMPGEVSWYQSYPQTSMSFVASLQLPLDANIIDIGGGDSYFVDALLDKGYVNIYVLDLSSVALERSKERLGSKALQVRWVVSDVTNFKPDVQFDFWHDRAAFHFLTAESDVSKYVDVAAQSMKDGGTLFVGTFSESGPAKCSGLDVRRYSESLLSATFKPAFDKTRCSQEHHITPSGVTQDFIFCSFKRKQRTNH